MQFLLEALKQSAPTGYVLAAGFLLSTYFFVQRFFYLQRITIDVDDLLLGLQTKLQLGVDGKTRLECIAICKGKGETPVCLVAEAVLNCKSQKVADMRLAADEVAVVEIPGLQRNAYLIAVIGYIGPFLGLFGTVIALWDVFHTLSSNQQMVTLNLMDMSSHFSVALFTTGLGLALAMLTILYNAILRQRAMEIVHDMTRVAGALITELGNAGDAAEDINRDLMEPEAKG